LEQTTHEPCKPVAEKNSTAVGKTATTETLANSRESREETTAVTIHQKSMEKPEAVSS
jgi:hypothetical protein